MTFWSKIAAHFEAAHFENLEFVEGSDCKIAPKDPVHFSPPGVNDIGGLEAPSLSALERVKLGTATPTPSRINGPPVTRNNGESDLDFVSRTLATSSMGGPGKGLEYFMYRTEISNKLRDGLGLDDAKIQEWWESPLIGFEDFTPEQILESGKTQTLLHWIDAEIGVS